MSSNIWFISYHCVSAQTPYLIKEQMGNETVLSLNREKIIGKPTGNFWATVFLRLGSFTQRNIFH